MLTRKANARNAEKGMHVVFFKKGILKCSESAYRCKRVSEMLTSTSHFSNYMVSNCPKCRKIIPDDSVYSPYCAHGIQPFAKTTRVSVGSALTIVAAAGSLIFLIISLKALNELFRYYPPEVAGGWLNYDVAFVMLAFVGFIFGSSASVLSLTRKGYLLTMFFSVLCMISGLGLWTVSMIIPYANVWFSFLYYFLPIVLPAFIGAALFYPRKQEFK